MLPEPGQRRWIVGTEEQDLTGDGNEGVQVEWAGSAVADPRDGDLVTASDGIAQLPRENACASNAEAAVFGCHQQVEVVLLHPVEVELPGDDAGAGGRLPKSSNVDRRPADGEPVVQPVRRRQPHRSRRLDGRRTRPRLAGRADLVRRGDDRWL